MARQATQNRRPKYQDNLMHIEIRETVKGKDDHKMDEEILDGSVTDKELDGFVTDREFDDSATEKELDDPAVNEVLYKGGIHITRKFVAAEGKADEVSYQ